MKVGIDVGGTNTDAVILDNEKVIASVKTPTSSDLGGGIVDALESLFCETNCSREAVTSVVVGTTQFTNAFVERRNLTEVGVLRLGYPSTTALPPLTDWPPSLRNAVGPCAYIVSGGYEFDGRELSPFSASEVRAKLTEIRNRGITSIAVSSVFATVHGEMERRVAEIAREEIPGVHVTLSQDIGQMGLLERESAAVINASLSRFAETVVTAFEDALTGSGLPVPFFFSQNDGTLLTASNVRKFPVLTFSSGPTNSMRGAARLSGKNDAIVVDIGGTTTDVGVLANGYPRESSMAVNIGGVKTNFRMPDIYSIGVGGGSLVRERSDGSVSIGPDSVGYELLTKGMIFGGSTLTATDLAVASGALNLGDRSKVAGLPTSLVTRGNDTIHHLVEDAIDRMKTSAVPVPVVLVGGGSALISRPLRGVSELIVPPHDTVANAIGAAVAQVGGYADRVFAAKSFSRSDAIRCAKEQAIDAAVRNGALAESVRVVDVAEVPLGYMSGAAIRIKVKAIGERQAP